MSLAFSPHTPAWCCCYSDLIGSHTLLLLLLTLFPDTLLMLMLRRSWFSHTLACPAAVAQVL